MTPRLTIGIPTHCRPDTLPRAIRSARAQSVECRIIIGHDGDDDDTLNRIRERFPAELEDGRVEYHRTGAACLMENWVLTAHHSRTEFFMWLQDDDVFPIMEDGQSHVAARVIRAFDAWPEADLWLATNKIALDDRHIWWNNGNGPWVPMKASGITDQWECEVFRPTCYFLSWSLSPAVAFRWGANFLNSLNALPLDCAIFAERLVLAGMTGRFVADPCVAGLWIQHKDNEHRKLHDDQPRQSKILIEHLDRLMDETPNWPDILDIWARLQNPSWILGWLGDLDHIEREGGKSRHGKAIRTALWRSLEGRVKVMPHRVPWWRRLLNKVAL